MVPYPICISLLTYLNRTGSDTLISFQMKQLNDLSYFAFKINVQFFMKRFFLTDVFSSLEKEFS